MYKLDNDRATHLLIHYLKTVYKAAGLKWDLDNNAEVRELIEEIRKPCPK
jgi:hypothetical protein